MKKEHVKSIILVMLVISNFVLSSKIWSNKKLWPSGYNFFVNVKNSFAIKGVADLLGINTSEYDSKTHINTPSQIIINTGYQTTRFALSQTHDMFNNVNELSQSVLSEALSLPAKFITAVNSDEWYSVLTSKSIYLNYNTEYSTYLFAQFFGVNETELKTFSNYISDIVITTDTSSETVVVYVKNEREDIYYKLQTSLPTAELDDMIKLFQQGFDDTDTDSANIINYSFELFLDRGEQKAILSPMIPIFSNPQDYVVIEAENPVMRSDGTTNTYVIDRLLNIFEINSATMNRYTEADGTIVFVENDTILKLSSDGIIEFSANAPYTGINLGESALTDEYTAICMAADFMDNVNSSISANRNLALASNLTDEYIKNAKTELYFNYMINGLPVNMNIENNQHAVSMTISNGYIQKYTQVLRSYSNTAETMQTASFIESLDDTLRQYESTPEQINVKKMYAAYSDDGQDGIKHAGWKVILDN